MLDWGLNPGPPALEASTLPLSYRGGVLPIFMNGILLSDRSDMSTSRSLWRQKKENESLKKRYYMYNEQTRVTRTEAFWANGRIK